jgi:hypothetical protein
MATKKALKSMEITVKQYAEKRRCTVQNVAKHIRNGNNLPGVIEVKRFANLYILVVAPDFFEESVK